MQDWNNSFNKKRKPLWSILIIIGHANYIVIQFYIELKWKKGTLMIQFTFKGI